MSATIEEYHSDDEPFDDDTDLPLPAPTLPSSSRHVFEDATKSSVPSTKSKPLPAQASTSADASSSAPPPPADNPMMASLQAMMAAMSQEEDPRAQLAQQPGVSFTKDTAAYKEWHAIYPIYLDAKRAYGSKGGRRVPRESAHWWPQTSEIVEAVQRLGLPVFHEITKCHPKDWENPGRVKTVWEKDGKILNPKIQNRKQLYVAVAEQMHRLKPAATRPANLSPPTRVPPAASISTTKAKSKTGASGPRPVFQRLPLAPEPHPDVKKRVSPYSPMVGSGHYLTMLQDEWKREQEKPKPEASEIGGDASPAAAAIEDSGKEKKEKKPKVKMVRGGKR